MNLARGRFHSRFSRRSGKPPPKKNHDSKDAASNARATRTSKDPFPRKSRLLRDRSRNDRRLLRSPSDVRASVLNPSWHCGEKALAFPAAHSPASLFFLYSCIPLRSLFSLSLSLPRSLAPSRTDTLVGRRVHEVNTGSTSNVCVCMGSRDRSRTSEASECRDRTAQRTTLDCEPGSTEVDDGNV